MDRQQKQVKRSAKSKVHIHGDLIALGTKSKSESESKLSSSSLQSKKSLPSLGSERKREGLSGSTSSIPTKKPRLHSQTFTPLGRPIESERHSSPTPHQQYDEVARDVEPGNLLEAINEAEENADDHEIERLLCGAVKLLKLNRSKPDPAVYLTLMFLAKSRPTFFESEIVIDALCSLLKRDVSVSFKAKGNAVVAVMTCNVLMAAFQDEENWPDAFLKVYMEDSLGERVWADRGDCKQFVNNIQTAFHTKLPKLSMTADAAKPEGSSGTGSPSPLTSVDDESESLDLFDLADDGGVNVFPRYTYQHTSVESYVMELIREHLNRRQPVDSLSRNLLRVMLVACGYSEVRFIAAQKLEMWLQNPKLSRPAQDLLMAVCLNCDQHSQTDVEVMSMLCKVRLKTKPLINHYMLCIRELLNQHESNLQTLLRHTVYNELSTSRNPNNMSLISAMFSHDPSQAARVLAEIFQDLLANKDDYLRALRTLLREIIRVTRHDLSFTEFALGLMRQRTETKFTDLDQPLKDRLLLSLADIISMTALLTINPSVREAATAYARADIKDIEVLRTYQKQMSTIQRDATWWLHSEVPAMFHKIRPSDYVFCIRKVLFMEKTDSYFKIDNWPPESDRGMMIGLASEVPVMEDTLMRILLMGLTSNLQLTPADALDMADMLVRRAAPLHAEGFPVLQVERIELIDAVLNLCTYHYPDNITLPKGYEPPTLAITNLYWKAWIMLLIIAAYNPATFGLKAWETYPTLSCFMEMAMTNYFKFPPLTMVTDDKAAEDIKNKEKQVAELEKQEILEFETHLAAATTKATITENSSLLLSQVTLMEPTGPARKPPVQVLEQLKQLNKALRLGNMLCRSRNPDFLLDIIRRQGTSQSMPWLADLVDSNEGSLEVLPVQCLCEFLLHDTPIEGNLDTSEEGETKEERKHRKHKSHKQQQLLQRLQTLVHSEEQDLHILSEILGFFLQRLSSNQTATRALAVKGLSMVLSTSELDHEPGTEQMDTAESDQTASHKWLLEQLPALPQFPAVKETVCKALRQACQVDTNVNSVSSYIIFLATHTKDMQLSDMGELALDLAQLIVERATLISYVLPQEDGGEPLCHQVLKAFIELFMTYLEKAQQPQEEAYSWSNTREQVLLQWETGESATMNILVVHAMVILLTFGRPNVESKFDQLLNKWFPFGGHPPSAYLVDTSEEALLLPDWLKLRMIRSTVDQLVDAALDDLEPAQLLLFVQSFGLPLQSMSKLLACLDRAATNNYEQLEAALVDKGYVMAQLVEVQHMRGATGGDAFYRLLKQEPPPPQPADVEMKPSPRIMRTMSQLQRTPDMSQAEQEPAHVQALLLKIFAGQTTKAEMQQLFRSMQKSIKKDLKMRDSVLLCLHNVLRGPEANKFTKGLTQHIHQTSALFRGLMLAQNERQANLLVSCLGDLLSSPAATPALSLLVHHLLAQMMGESLGTHLQDRVARLQASSPGAEQQFQSDMKQMLEDSDPKLENFTSTANMSSIQQGGAGRRTQSVCTLLSTRDTKARGLLVDWLGLLDPEVVSQCPELEQQLLFGRETGEPAGGSSSHHAYLLALLVHQSSWSTLRSAVSAILKQAPGKYNATTVLDFLWACIHIPKLWQGRDKKLPKHFKPEDVLQLTNDQLGTLTDYVMCEACSKLQSDDTSHDQLPAEVNRVIEQRLKLLLDCCHGNRNRTHVVVCHINSAISDKRFSTAVCKELLMQLYLQLPALYTWLAETTGLELDVSTVKGSVTWLDSVSHQLLSSLANTKMGKACESKMYDANIACRKLAVDHPVLMLRQLPMVSGILQGRADYTYGEMKARNHLLLYTHILGILELLQPYVFQPDYQSPLQGIFDSYFTLIKSHGLEHKHLAAVVTKFVKFLSNFVSYDSHRACGMLHRYTEVLSALGTQYSEFATLKSLLATLSLPRQTHSEAETEVCESVLTRPPRPSSPWSIAQVSPFLQKLRKGASTGDILEVLTDLDETSKRKVDILNHFLGELKLLLCDKCESVRNTAHMLIMRHLRQNPSSAGDFVGALLHCLESGDPDVITSTLKNLPEFSLLAQGKAISLLEKAFDISVHTKIAADSFLGEAVQLLNLETVL